MDKQRNKDLDSSQGVFDTPCERKRQTLIKRLVVMIMLLLKENPVLPLGFKFRGKCLLMQLKKDRKIYKEKLMKDLEKELIITQASTLVVPNNDAFAKQSSRNDDVL